MEITVSIDKFAATPDVRRVQVVLNLSGVTARIPAEEALQIARKIELAASEAIGVSA